MLQQFQDRTITASDQLRIDHTRSRSPSSEHNRREDRHRNQDREASNVARMTATRSDWQLHPTFLPRQVEREPIRRHITDDILEANVKYMHLSADVRQLINLNQFMNQHKVKARNHLERKDKRPRGQVRQGTHPVEYKDSFNKIYIPTFNGTR